MAQGTHFQSQFVAVVRTDLPLEVWLELVSGDHSQGVLGVDLDIDASRTTARVAILSANQVANCLAADSCVAWSLVPFLAVLAFPAFDVVVEILDVARKLAYKLSRAERPFPSLVFVVIVSRWDLLAMQVVHFACLAR